MRVIFVVGARPNFMKLGPIIKRMKNFRGISSIIVHTGQHYDKRLSKIFFDELNLPKPNVNLNVGSSSHAVQTADIMKKLEIEIIRYKPNMVVVIGDVNSTLAGALVASKLNIPLAHVEAGVRSFDYSMPEEINRVLTDRVSQLLFCPSKIAVKNLINEGIKKGVTFVGDVMYDAFLENINKAEKQSKILKKIKLKKRSYFLATIHRQSNTNVFKNLKTIFASFKESNEKIIIPLHPRTLQFLNNYKINLGENIELIEPVGYFDMLILEKYAKKILTDSGGVQKEAFFLGVPCITLRESTEWTETVDSGNNVLVGSNKKKILEAIRSFSPKNNMAYPYGTGKASFKICNLIIKNLR